MTLEERKKEDEKLDLLIINMERKLKEIEAGTGLGMDAISELFQQVSQPEYLFKVYQEVKELVAQVKRIREERDWY